MFLSPLKTSQHLRFSDISSMGGDKSEHWEEIGKQPAYSRTNIICCIVLKIIYMNLQRESSLNSIIWNFALEFPVIITFRSYEEFSQNKNNLENPLRLKVWASVRASIINFRLFFLISGSFTKLNELAKNLFAFTLESTLALSKTLFWGNLFIFLFFSSNTEIYLSITIPIKIQILFPNLNDSITPWNTTPT